MLQSHVHAKAHRAISFGHKLRSVSKIAYVRTNARVRLQETLEALSEMHWLRCNAPCRRNDAPQLVAKLHVGSLRLMPRDDPPLSISNAISCRARRGPRSGPHARILHIVIYVLALSTD